MAEYSEWLMDLYERQGQRNELLAELEYHVFTLSSGGMEMLDRFEAALKKRYPDEMLEAYARILMKEAAASN